MRVIFVKKKTSQLKWKGTKTGNIKKFEKSYLALFIRFFFCDICTLEELLYASGLRKYQKFEFFFENVVFWGPFLAQKVLLFHGILKKPINFNI
jgi:hypothetical protein